MKRVLLLAGFIFIFSSFSYAAKPAKSKKVPKGFVFIEGTTLKGGQKYKGPKNNYVFIEGRTIELKDFYICDHEVTYSEFYYDSGKYDKAEKNKPASFTWSRAIEYCNKRSIKEGLTPCYSGADNYVTCDFEADGYRLPTLAEWIYAAMGGNKVLPLMSRLCTQGQMTLLNLEIMPGILIIADGIQKGNIQNIILMM
jgi:formylglycine-generating enzyme required for sulfatase activity